MVFLQLEIKADLENVTDLVPASDDFEFFFRVKCNSCNEVHPKPVSLNRIEKRSVTGGKNSTAHFVWRCDFCKRESSAKFDVDPPRPYNAENGQWAPLLRMDCRGLEFLEFNPKGIWKCVGAESKTPFLEVDLFEGEWVDYDEKAQLPVGVSNFGSQWNRA